MGLRRCPRPGPVPQACRRETWCCRCWREVCAGSVRRRRLRARGGVRVGHADDDRYFGAAVGDDGFFARCGDCSYDGAQVVPEVSQTVCTHRYRLVQNSTYVAIGLLSSPLADMPPGHGGVRAVADRDGNRTRSQLGSRLPRTALVDGGREVATTGTLLSDGLFGQRETASWTGGSV